MKITVLLLVLIAITSCRDGAENNPAFGAWEHVESLSDIGDGNATYQKVDSDKTLLFTAYGTVISNKNVCVGNNYTDATVATWNPDENSFNAGDCIASYELDEAQETLTVSYQCMEACGEKYVRAK
ncbi:hypothetical protein [Nonlabens antarcticus]|uniref:hypothetical protein n=1 Tax=Nonlabens antarcticus TaxID=392714 RepID=UPI001891EDBF|nr:hypothetical protein [Nonlabens antarcticus]